ncbi:hypothetical protein [Oceanobacillus senegalensis]|uniref:hypothetical protein n=1 Tax=Oceanobacillus senegalensis TaxID=1936063 RepID=UPI000A3144F3
MKEEARIIEGEYFAAIKMGILRNEWEEINSIGGSARHQESKTPRKLLFTLTFRVYYILISQNGGKLLVINENLPYLSPDTFIHFSLVTSTSSK